MFQPECSAVKKALFYVCDSYICYKVRNRVNNTLRRVIPKFLPSIINSGLYHHMQKYNDRVSELQHYLTELYQCSPSPHWSPLPGVGPFLHSSHMCILSNFNNHISVILQKQQNKYLILSQNKMEQIWMKNGKLLTKYRIKMDTTQNQNKNTL